MQRGYHIVVDLDAQPCLVIGAGEEAERKAAELAACGARVARLGQYTPGCLQGFFLVIQASPDRSCNPSVYEEAARCGTLLNCVDDPAHCRFLSPSVLRRGDLSIAVSTAGACPALAVRLKERLSSQVGPEYGAFLELAREARPGLSRRVPDFAERRRRWYALVDSPVLGLLRAGDLRGARRLLGRLLFGEELP